MPGIHEFCRSYLESTCVQQNEHQTPVRTSGYIRVTNIWHRKSVLQQLQLTFIKHLRNIPRQITI